MALYQDPSEPRRRPSLVPALMTIPATAVQHQHENQATAVLAWLADQSLPFGRCLAQLFLGSVEPADAVASIGARTQLSLPRPDGRGTVFPDLSLEGSGRSFQVLVEVKVGSEFGVHTDETGEAVLQQEVYRRLWATMPDVAEARVRAVATLTRDGQGGAADLASMRGRDASWSEIRSLLDELLDHEVLGSGIELVAASFRDAIATHIAPSRPDPETTGKWLSAHRPLVRAIANEVMRKFHGTKLTGGSGRSYVGERIALPDRGGTALIVRLYATPAGGALNVGGWGDALVAVLERDSDGNLDTDSVPAARGAGFERRRDLDGFWMHRAIWSLDDSDTGLIAADLVGRLQRTGLLRQD